MLSLPGQELLRPGQEAEMVVAIDETLQVDDSGGVKLDRRSSRAGLLLPLLELFRDFGDEEGGGERGDLEERGNGAYGTVVVGRREKGS